MNEGTEGGAVTVPTVRRVLDEASTSAVTSTPPWERIEKGLLAVRRRRHRRITAALAGGLTAVVALVGVVEVQDLRGRADALVEVADQPDERVPGPGLTWGRLGANPSWVARFERWAGTQEFTYADTRVVPGSGNVHLLFADDVGGHRFALVELTGEYGSAAGFSWRYWYVGAAGAAPDELTMHRMIPPVVAATPQEITSDTVLADPDIVPWVAVGPGTAPGGESSEDTVIVALTDLARDVSLFTEPAYAADGSVTWRRSALRRTAPSVYTAVLRDRPAGPLAVHYQGRGKEAVSWTERASGTVLAAGPQGHPDTDRELLDGSLPALRGDTVPEDASLLDSVTRAQRASGLAPGDSRRRVLARLRLDRTGPGSGSDVIAVTAPRGAHVISVVPWNEDLAGEERREGAVAVLPAGPLEAVGLAWSEYRQDPDTGADTGPFVTLLRPRGAVTARVTSAGRPHTVRLDADITVSDVPVEDARASVDVVFLDGDGHDLVRTRMLRDGVSAVERTLPGNGW